MSIGDVLSELLKKYNLSALELERLTGVPSSTIYRLLKDKGGNPTIEVLKKLSSFFQITVSQLIGEEPIGCKQIPLIQPPDIYSFINSPKDRKLDLDSVPIDFPLSSKCFGTLCQDNMMEPFILVNSIVIVDPERNIANKDFVLLIKNKNEKPIIRQIISDGDDFYLKILNSNFPVELKKIDLKNYQFIGVIVHYRTNLFDLHFPNSNRNYDDSTYNFKK
ncbi:MULTISPECIES: XRE family transcriptional regulator [Fluoribacter]|jgi:transcriptional regulator with XRE-family HTH domain|uniref:XRE family transcriptional regulator n=1 Tax=Fluoribacter TaxID=461 RepID=UPI0010417DF3|nr:MULTISPECIES: XRE family transcriptional regulator [Fluoribacter]MCW8419999.1 XRE family transcriptional regulator [Fluoribacter dumoffii]